MFITVSGAVDIICIVGGAVITGAVVSDMVTVCMPLACSPAPSTTVQVTVVAPRGKPFAGASLLKL
jgi:hypothetical protein